MRVLLVIALVAMVVACDSDADPGPTTSSSTTTTTIENDTCDRVGVDTVRYLEDLIDTLDDTRLAELVEPTAWGQDLRDLQRAGKDLDLRVGALRCDPVEIQQRAFGEADMAPGGPLSAALLDLLLAPGPSTSTTTVPATTTTDPVATTSSTAVSEGTTTTSGG